MFARTFKTLTGMGLAGFVLAGCVGQQLEMAREAPSGAAPFEKALYKNYVSLAAAEYAEGDFRDSDAFADRAIAAGGGAPPGPEPVDARKIAAEHQGALKAAYRELNEALEAGSAKFPKLAAIAQTSYDCWMQEQEEDLQPGHIAGCRADFEFALGALKAALTPPPPPKKAEAPKPKPEPRRYEKYVVLFDHDSSAVSKGEEKTINKAVLSIDTHPASRVIVSGFTDRSGPAAYNLKLAERRALAVAEILDENSSTDLAGKIEIKAHGEARNEVPTGDGVREPKNRRAQIDVVRR